MCDLLTNGWIVSRREITALCAMDDLCSAIQMLAPHQARTMDFAQLPRRHRSLASLNRGNWTIFAKANSLSKRRSCATADFDAFWAPAQAPEDQALAQKTGHFFRHAALDVDQLAKTQRSPPVLLTWDAMKLRNRSAYSRCDSQHGRNISALRPQPPTLRPPPQGIGSFRPPYWQIGRPARPTARPTTICGSERIVTVARNAIDASADLGWIRNAQIKIEIGKPVDREPLPHLL